MTIDASVRYFSSTMSGAPIISRAVPRSGIQAIKAILVDGFGGTLTPTSVEANNGSVAFTFSVAHPFLGFGFGPSVHPVVRVSGCSDAAVNGDHRIYGNAANSFTLLIDGVANGAKSGATVRRAPAGWHVLYESTDNIAISSNHPLYSGWIWRLNAASTEYSLAIPYLTMSGPVTGTNAGNWATILRNAFQKDGATPWEAVADGRSLYVFCTEWSATTPNFTQVTGLGDMETFPGDLAPIFGLGHNGLINNFYNLLDHWGGTSEQYRWGDSHVSGKHPVTLNNVYFGRYWAQPMYSGDYYSTTLDMRLPTSRQNLDKFPLTQNADAGRINLLMDGVPRGTLRGIYSGWNKDTNYGSEVLLPNGRIARKWPLYTWLMTGNRNYGAALMDLEGPW